MSSESLVGTSSNQTALMSSTVSNGVSSSSSGGGGELGASLLSDGNGSTSLPKLAAKPMVQVVAPATMAEGYEFQVEISGRTFPVTVPAGGVQQGDRFQVPMPESSGEVLNQAISFPRITIPVGHWRDGLCSCCFLGICHSVMWMGFLCLPVLMGQVMTRLHLNFLGQAPSTLASETSEGPKSWKLTWFITVGITLGVLIVERLCWYGITGHLILDPNSEMAWAPYEHPVAYFLRIVLMISYFLYGVWIVYHTRRFLRAKYAIPPECGSPAGEEASSAFAADLAVSCCCSCCAATQMARHTADYQVYPAVCCNESGLPSGVPDIV